MHSSRRVSGTLARYIVREVLLYTSIGFAGIGSILLVQNLLRQLEDLSSVGLQATDLAGIVGSLIGMMSAYAVPIAFLFGVLVAVGRISSDSELTAMRALGVSHLQFAVPFLVLAMFFSGLTWWLLDRVEPDARQGLRSVAVEIAKRGALIEPGRFRRLDRAGERLLFVDAREPDGLLRGVAISDRANAENPFVVFAESGRFDFDAGEGKAHLLLEQGDIHFEALEANDLDHRRIAFATFDYGFELSEAVSSGPCAVMPSEMSTRRVREILAHFRSHDGKPPECARVKTVERYEIQRQRRLALPVAPLLFALLGVSLGIQRSRGARSWGVLICVGLAFGYYVLLSFGTFLAEERVLPAWLGLWLPNLVCAAAAGPLLVRSAYSDT